MFSMQYFHYILCSIFILFSPLAILADATEDAFVVMFMVKNDETEICKALEPYVKKGMQSFFIYDIGSTDNTIQVIKDYFCKHNIRQYCLIQDSFKDTMVKTQNYMLELAEQCFPAATFLFMPGNLQDQLHGISKLQKFCREEKNASINCYKILERYFDKKHKEFAFGHHPGLVRAHTNTRFSGVLAPDNHINDKTSHTVHQIPHDIFFACTLRFSTH